MYTLSEGMASSSSSSPFLTPQKSTSAGDNWVMKICQIQDSKLTTHLISNHGDGGPGTEPPPPRCCWSERDWSTLYWCKVTKACLMFLNKITLRPDPVHTQIQI